MMFAQDVRSDVRVTNPNKRVQPRFWIYLDKDTPKISTRLFEVKDSALVISKSSLLKVYYDGNYLTDEINIKNIKTIRYLNTNNIITGMVLGGLAGILVGAVIGSNEEDSPDSFLGPGPTAGEKAMGDIFTGALVGIGIGTLVGSFRIKIRINGNVADYSKHKSHLEKDSVKKKYLSSQ
jgi:hypothetical protein